MNHPAPVDEPSTEAVPIILPEALQQLPPLPEVLSRALQITRDGESRRSDLARALELDEALTGRFLRMVNSAYYGLPRRVTSLDEAIGYLGYRTVEEVIISLSVSGTLARPLPSYGLERHLLWEHSVAVAEGSLWIAEVRGLTPESDAYVAGLLHDAGKLVLDTALKGQSAAWAKEGTSEGSPWPDVERGLSGRDHAEIGGVLTRAWNLPDRVVEAVAQHHTPERARLDPSLAAVVHVADAGALMAGVGVGVDGLRYPLVPEAIELLAFTDDDMSELVNQILMGVERAKDFLSAAA